MEKTDTLIPHGMMPCEVFSQLSLDGNLSVNQTLLIFLLYLRKTLKSQLVLAIFYVRGYLPLTFKISFTSICGLAVYVKEGLHCA